MAKIVEDIVVIKFSRIIKDTEHNPEPAISDESVGALEQVAQELVGQHVIVEVARHDDN